MADRLYVSNKNETVRMFESDFMEFFSRVHPVIPLALYLPVVGYMLYVSLWRRQLSFVAVAALFLLGILLWTLIEYLIHRYIFHYEPKTRWGKQLHFVIHGVHHDYPNDARRLVMPPAISIPLAFLFFGLFFLIFGSLAPAVFAGLVFGYLCYDMLHYATHHLAMKSGVWLWLKQYHLRHHFKDDHVGYGISSPLWDYVFRTTRK
ncbi:MAG: fatty acid hydroxylase [Verrucomicrobia bacterium]|nr:MAG: fatty acid hydroxylase [Verrucomicrobia bacterium 13_1_20CM_4_54_11]OLE09952.1 MAG: fatty acid hydroxylase [Verrucomicrobia bacterium 13_1_20CM_3_54_17]PYK15614.1 MAG: fatty acid hydroxylase [Verrucomicrobiota bacterium]PYL40443.1 MAG: fatty acid hydroxylase [Verrucomicrobiota bacterium]